MESGLLQDLAMQRLLETLALIHATGHTLPGAAAKVALNNTFQQQIGPARIAH